MGDTKFTYKFNNGNYLIKAYAKSENGRQKKSSVVAYIECRQGKAQDCTDKMKNLNLKYRGHHVEKESNNHYIFYVDYDYSWRSTISWYIYRNGGSYSYEQTQENSLDVQFDEPGTYTVLYYLKTLNGDNEFWNFDEIIVE